MLIIIHGIAAVRKHYIGSGVAESMSKVETTIGDYTYKFNLNPIEVWKNDTTGSSGVLVFKPSTTLEDDGVNTLFNGLGDLSIDEGNIAFENALDATRFVKVHTNEILALDCDKDDATVIGSTEWNEFITNLNRPVNAVIAASYSIEYINAITAAYNGDVKVINIIRNPSISFLMTDDDTESLDNAIINNIALLNKTTIKFEDIIVNGSFEFEGITIALDEFENFNDSITVFESNLQLDATGLADYNTNATDVFSALGYDPLDYDTIISSRP